VGCVATVAATAIRERSAVPSASGSTAAQKTIRVSTASALGIALTAAIARTAVTWPSAVTCVEFAATTALT
jgi:hypothetical protein